MFVKQQRHWSCNIEGALHNLHSLQEAGTNMTAKRLRRPEKAAPWRPDATHGSRCTSANNPVGAAAAQRKAANLRFTMHRASQGYSNKEGVAMLSGEVGVCKSASLLERDFFQAAADVRCSLRSLRTWQHVSCARKGFKNPKATLGCNSLIVGGDAWKHGLHGLCDGIGSGVCSGHARH